MVARLRAERCVHQADTAETSPVIGGMHGWRVEHSSKLSILSNDLVKRLLNTKEDIQQPRKDQIIDDYSLKLLRSGYSVNVTRTILISGLRSYNKKVTAAKESGQPLHCPAHTSLESRLRKKIFKKTSWLKGKKKNAKKFHKNIKPKKSTTLRGKSPHHIPSRITHSPLCYDLDRTILPCDSRAILYTAYHSKTRRLCLISYHSLHINTRIKSNGCFEKFRKFSI